MIRNKEDGSTSPYSGRWIARIGQRIISQGGSPDQVFTAAKAIRPKEQLIIAFIPTQKIMPFHPILAKIQKLLFGEGGIYLAGGAVRDALLQEEGNDLDFAVQKNTEKLARRVANAMGSDFYILDRERESFRLIVRSEADKLFYVDFTRMRGATIDADLSARDFTINAMAIDLHDPQKLIDPLGGAQDLKDKILRVCSPSAIQDDPVRIIRAARLAVGLQLKLDRDTLAHIRKNIASIADVSPERRRDEFFKGLAGMPSRFLSLLFHLIAIQPLSTVFDLQEEKKEHWLARVRILERLLAAISADTGDRQANIWTSTISAELGRFKDKIQSLHQEQLHQDRTRQSLWVLACLYWSGLSADQLNELGSDLVLSNHEQSFLEKVWAGLNWLEQNTLKKDELDDRSIYRFYKCSGNAGIDAAWLYLVNAFIGPDGRYASQIPLREMRIASVLMQAWWERRAQVVDPPDLLDGNDLQEMLVIPPGPVIGDLLSRIKEEQAAGTVNDKARAIDFVKGIMENGIQ